MSCTYVIGPLLLASRIFASDFNTMRLYLMLHSRIVLTFLLSVSSYVFAYSDDDISRRPLKGFEENEQSEDRINILTKEVQNLTGRVEMLEHLVSQMSNNTAIPNHNKQSRAHDIKSDSEQVSGLSENLKNNSSYSENNVVAEDDADSEKKQYDRALIALKENNFNEAEERFSTFISKYPKSPLLSNAYFWYGEVFFRRGEFDQAALQYLKCYKQFPKSAKAADSLLKLAISLGEMKKIKESCAMLAKLSKEFKDRPAASIKRAKDAANKYGCSASKE